MIDRVNSGIIRKWWMSVKRAGDLIFYLSFGSGLEVWYSRGMALTPSTFILKTGEQAPAFSLPYPKLSGAGASDEITFDQIKGAKGTLVVFACNHCPYVVHLTKELGDLAREIAELGVSTVAISSNDVENYPQDSPEKMVEFAEESAWGFPYLYDASQEVAKAYSAACTPDFFLFNEDEALFYAGQFDDSRPGSGKPTGDDLRNAVKCMVDGKDITGDLIPATGCNIKWKAGNEPSY